jgi:hypothetical protein
MSNDEWARQRKDNHVSTVFAFGTPPPPRVVDPVIAFVAMSSHDDAYYLTLALI